MGYIRLRPKFHMTQAKTAIIFLYTIVIKWQDLISFYMRLCIRSQVLINRFRKQSIAMMCEKSPLSKHYTISCKILIFLTELGKCSLYNGTQVLEQHKSCKEAQTYNVVKLIYTFMFTRSASAKYWQASTSETLGIILVAISDRLDKVSERIIIQIH